MKAFLIDPDTQDILEVDYSGDFTAIYSFIQADTFCCSRFSDVGDCVYLDDDGLANQKSLWNFKIMPADRLYAGKGLVLGTDEEGDSVEPSVYVTLEFLKENVVWYPNKVFSHMTTSESVIDHPVFGKCVSMSVDPVYLDRQ